MLSSPVLPSFPSPQPSLFQKGSPSPEGAIPGDGTLRPLTDVGVRDQLVLIDELAVNHLWEESLVRFPGGQPRAATRGPHAYLGCGATAGDRELEDDEGPRLLGRGAAGRSVGQVDAAQGHPVC